MAGLLLDRGADVNQADVSSIGGQGACGIGGDGEEDSRAGLGDYERGVRYVSSWCGAWGVGSSRMRAPVCVSFLGGGMYCGATANIGGGVCAVQTDGATPLYVACEKGHQAVAGLLLDRDVDVNKARVSRIGGQWACGECMGCGW